MELKIYIIDLLSGDMELKIYIMDFRKLDFIL